MLRCSNGSYYTGYTVNLVRRYWQHLNRSGGARYTAAFHPTGVACCWVVRDTKGTALRIEHMVRKLGRTAKDHLAVEPDRLVELVRTRLGLEVVLEPFDPLLIENEVAKHGKCPAVDPFGA